MNIFYYFYELKSPMYYWQRIHLIDELERGGHKVVTYNPLDYKTIDEANEKVVEAIKKCGNIDLFMTCDESSIIYPGTVREIKKLGIATCLICWDNLELPYKQKAIAPEFDVVWLTSYETRYLFEKWGCKKICFQTYAANPYTFKPNYVAPINSICFIGSPYGSRVNKINDLLNNGINCSVYSNSLFQKGYNSSVGGVHHYDPIDVIVKATRYLRFPIGRKVLYSTIKNKFSKKSTLETESPYIIKNKSVSDEVMMELYSNHSLSLNISELRDTYILNEPIHKIHLRAFEIPMCGGLQLASYNEELSKYFEEDKEIVFYRNLEEMIDKARFYTNPKQDAAVLRMKQAARKRAENEHTWTIRFNEIFKML